MSGKKISIIILALIIASAGFLLYQGEKIKRAQKIKASESQASLADSSAENGDTAAVEAELDQADQDFEALCENGEWVKIADVGGDAITLAGKLRGIYPDDEIADDLKGFSFYIAGKESTALSGSGLSALGNFEDRDVEVKGVKSPDGKSVAVSEVRCAGAETDKTAIENRNNFMSWIAENISSVVPQKAPYQNWIVDTVEFVDGKNAYVEYYDTAEDDENASIDESVDTSRKILLEISAKSEGGYDAKVLAYWEMGEDEFVLKDGSDKFENAKDTFMYQYDLEENSWSRIY